MQRHLVQGATTAEGSASFPMNGDTGAILRAQPSGGSVTVAVTATATALEEGAGSPIAADGALPVVIPASGSFISWRDQHYHTVTVAWEGLPPGESLDVWVRTFNARRR